MIRSNFDDTHTKILDCGKKHFLKNGFEKASLRDICKDVDGTIETALFLFDNKEIYALLINGSFGSSYANFLEKLTEMEDNTRIKMQEVYSVSDNSYEHISNKGFHIINHSHFLALTEAVLHSENEDELIENAKLVSRFFSGGWKTIRGY